MAGRSFVVRASLCGLFVAAAAVAAQPAAAQEQSFSTLYRSGPYVGVHGGYFWGETRLSDNGVASGGGDFNGLIGGALAGYSILLNNNLTLGVEADVGFADAHGHGSSTSRTTTTTTITTTTTVPDHYVYDLNHNAHIRGLVGIVSGNMHFFVAGGAAFANVHLGEIGSWSYTGTFTGWTVGAGVERQFANNWSGRLEVLYDDYGQNSYRMGTGSTASICAGAITGVTLRGALVYHFAVPK